MSNCEKAHFVTDFTIVNREHRALLVESVVDYLDRHHFTIYLRKDPDLNKSAVLTLVVRGE